MFIFENPCCNDLPEKMMRRGVILKRSSNLTPEILILVNLGVRPMLVGWLEGRAYYYVCTPTIVRLLGKAYNADAKPIDSKF